MPREAPHATQLTIQGTQIPKLGFGTWQLTGAACVEAVRDALQLGYRHIDTARMYGNEAEVGEGLARSGVERGHVFLTTKIWPTHLRAAQVRSELEASLLALAVEHVDLLLIHWPSPDVPLAETLGAMTELQEEGKASHLGVSNFSPRLVREAAELAPIVCNQVEYHPYLDRHELLELSREYDLLLAAYSPLAQGELLREPALREIGAEHGKSPGQVVLRWLLDQPHVAALPKAASHEHRAANADVFDFELTDDDLARIAGLQRG
jgi:diketogulonate reductase-like aldo/keto reductase